MTEAQAWELIAAIDNLTFVAYLIFGAIIPPAVSAVVIVFGGGSHFGRTKP